MHLPQNSRNTHQDSFHLSRCVKHCAMTNSASGLPMHCTAWTDAPGKYAPNIVYVIFPYFLSEAFFFLCQCAFFQQHINTHTHIYIFVCAYKHIYSGGERHWPKCSLLRTAFPCIAASCCFALLQAPFIPLRFIAFSPNYTPDSVFV